MRTGAASGLMTMGRVSMASFVAAVLMVTAATAETQQAVFGMGCFWCGEEAMEKVEGVLCAESGYTGGEKVNPTYYEVVRGSTGHLEAVRVIYDDAVISYEELLGYFWHNVNPLQGNGQFCDTGNGGSYLSAIFYSTEAEQQLAQASLDRIVAERPEWKGAIETSIRPLDVFYIAEPNHQDYYVTNPFSYSRYKLGCGRVNTLKDIWGEEAYSAYHPDVTAAGTLNSALCSSSDPEDEQPSSVTGGSSAAVNGGSSVTGGSSAAPPPDGDSNDSTPPPDDDSAAAGASAGRAASYAVFLAASVALLLPAAALAT